MNKHCRAALVAALVVATSILMPIAFAETYAFHPSSTLRLGSGVDPSFPTETYPPCVQTGGDFTRAAQTAVPSTQWNSSIVQSRRELYQKLNVDASLSANFLFASGNASISIDNEYAFGSDDLVWVLSATSDYGHFAIDESKFTLTEDARKSLQLGTEHFLARCGKEYVVEERRVAQIAVVFAMHNLSESEKRKFSAAAEASGMGWGFSTKINQMSQFKNKNGLTTVNIYASGGNGITKLSGLTSKDSLKDVQSIIQTYIDSQGVKQASPVEFYTASWTRHGIGTANNLNSAQQKLFLSELYFSYRDCEAQLRRVGQGIRQAALPASKLSSAQVESLQRDYARIGGYLSRMLTDGQSCLKSNNNCAEITPPPLCRANFPEAVFEVQYFDRNDKGELYVTSFSLVTEDRDRRGAREASGSFDLGKVEGVIYAVEYFCQLGDPCGWSYNPNGGYATNVTLSGDSRSFVWRRKWDGAPVTEGYKVFYRVPRLVCVENCSWDLTVVDKSTNRITKVAAPRSYPGINKR